MEANRPVGVAIVAILILLTGIGLVIRGILGLVNGGEGGEGIVVAVVLLAVGAGYALVAKGIWSGRRAARLVVTILTLVAIIGSVATLTESGETLASVVQVIVALAIIVLLYAGRAREFFGRS